MRDTFEGMARRLALTSREGDLVQIAAPVGTLAAEFNGHQGELREYGPGGWIVARLEGHGDRRFRADEILIL